MEEIETSRVDFLEHNPDSPASISSIYEHVAPQMRFEVSKLEENQTSQNSNRTIHQKGIFSRKNSNGENHKKIPYRKILEGLAARRLATNMLKRDFQTSGFAHPRSMEHLTKSCDKRISSLENYFERDSYGQQNYQRLNFYKFSSPLELRNKPSSGIQRTRSYSKVVNKFLSSRNKSLDQDNRKQHSQAGKTRFKPNIQNYDLRFKSQGIQHEAPRGNNLQEFLQKDSSSHTLPRTRGKNTQLQKIQLGSHNNDYDPAEDSPMRNEHIRKLYLNRKSKVQNQRKISSFSTNRKSLKQFQHKHNSNNYSFGNLDKKQVRFETLKVQHKNSMLFKSMREKFGLVFRRLVPSSSPQRDKSSFQNLQKKTNKKQMRVYV
ncbi:unnamed protein product [Moneuplotes crassus]|uniref:Uncharacterized protein n=1 Tax=Euplotes crassus TaxID=5936 RepID=A0AAD1XD85_EUPCR|nr:unnamed protein product [Moneuplotes crassus]